MHICFILMEYPISHVNGKNVLDNTGGAGISVRNLSQGLKAKRHSISIISRTLNCSESSYFNDNGVDIYKVYSENPILETLKVTDLLKTLSKKKKIDIVETCDYAPLVGEYIENVPLVLRQRVSYGFMNYHASKINSPYEIKELKYLLRSFELHIADSYAGVSRYILNAQKRFHKIPHEKIYGVIYNGLNDNIQKTSTSYNKNVIFCHGTVSKRKGTDKVCRIFKKVKNSQKESKLLIIGQDNDFWAEYCLPELLTLNKKDYKYLEYISQSNTIQNISESGIYLSMSNLEAMSNSMMEAMRLGKPLVLLKNGSFEEFIENGVEGFIVNNEQEAVERILELMKNEELYMKMSNAAYEKSKQYTIQRCVDETEKWYNSILDNKERILKQRQPHFSELLKQYYRLAISITKA